MNDQSYPPAVEHLLTLGRPVGFEPSDWHRSVAGGVTREHVPDLIRMLGDPSLNDQRVDDTRFYGPVHAWRAIGHFKAVEAVDDLIRCLDVRQRWDDFDDWSIEEVPRVLAAIGPGALPAMVDAIANPATQPCSASALAEGLAKMAVALPEHREHIVARLIEVGERFAEFAPEANTGIVMALLGLKAMEAVPLLRRMFHADAVDAEMVGDWGDVRRELSLERHPDDPPERRPEEFVHAPNSPIGKLARRLELEERWKESDAPAQPPDAPAKHSAKWHRKQAKKRKQQTRRC
jgi:hypothetical protein